MVGGMLTTSYGDVMGNYTASMMHLEEIKNEFSPQFQCSWNALEHELTVIPTPRFPTRGLIKVFKRQKTAALFNSVLFRKLVVAEAGIVWTRALGKYNITLSGGGTLNTDSLRSEFITDRNDLYERIRSESPIYEFLVG